MDHGASATGWWWKSHVISISHVEGYAERWSKLPEQKSQKNMKSCEAAVYLASQVFSEKIINFSNQKRKAKSQRRIKVKN
jgi:hypothetical protein